MSDEVLVKVEGVSKKFCCSLKRSLWYGVQDVGSGLTGRKGRDDELRKNIYVNGAVLGFTKKEIDRQFDAIVDFAEIEEFIDLPVQTFSPGI